ncbi:MAG: hypothetical protein HZB51_26630 [Chloroflexi bacterium]|nr:hypothetical protein [Chloroflexota bacterium]
MNTLRSARQRAIERHIARLERRLVPVQIASDRISWLRAGVFIAMLIVAAILGFQGNVLGCLLALLVGLLLFFAVVWYHRGLEHWIDVFKTWRAIRSDQLARMTHDWECLDRYFPTKNRTTSPLELDLDLTGPRSLQQLLDTTQSRQASQLLVSWLAQHNPVLDGILARQNIVRELVAFTRFRDRIRLIFRLMLQEPLEGEKLVNWLLSVTEAHRLKWALPVATVLVALNLVLYALYVFDELPPYWLISLAIYALFFFANQSWAGEILGALSRMEVELDRLGAILNYVENVSFDSYDHLVQLCAPLRDAAHPPSSYVRKIKLASIGIGLRSNPILGLILNLVLPWDFIFAYLTNRFRSQVVESLPVWLHVYYELDAYAALANFAYVNPEYVFPDITPNAGPVLSAKDLGHPLIPFAQSVRNDFTLNSNGELAIITGSNMAGKSTFLKSIGINLCLAYAGAPVVATHFRAQPFRLYTCIHITDSVTDGFSYFYAEVKCLKRLLDELEMENDFPLLYLIDEIFRGTNNRERLLGSRAFIQAIVEKNGVGLLATHDLELASLSEQRPQVHNYHFRDEVSDGRLIFDYKIRTGPCPTTNALKIMQMEGLPVPS